MEKDSRQKDDEPDAPSGSKPAETVGGKLAKLKPVADYCVRNFAPALSILAIAIALFSVYNAKTSQARLAETVAKMEAMTARIDSYNGDIKKYEAATMAAMLKEKTLHEEERKRQDDLVRQIIQSVTQQQVKMKISPTLEEIIQAGMAGREVQKQQGAASTANATKILPASSVPAIVGKSKKQPDAAPAVGATKAASASSAPAIVNKPGKQPGPARVDSDNKKAAADNSAQPQKELSPQVKAMKEAIERYNKENR